MKFSLDKNLTFEQAKAIYELRRRKIHLDSIQQLNELDCLSSETLEKIAPYLNFDKNQLKIVGFGTVFAVMLALVKLM